jgi:cation transport regulator
MPYASIENLPQNIRAHLPVHAQEIYKDAFNNALRHYGDEQTAFRVAWSAVKKQYEKTEDGSWHRKIIL